jgi:hypothetical protein
MYKTGLIIIIAAFLFSCGGHSERKSNTATQASPALLYQLDERLAGTDSIVFVFFDDPFTKDSLQYTRYYTQFATTDTGYIQHLQQSLQQPFTKLEKTKPCRNEAKAWLYANGKIFQTLYFAWTKQGCDYIYIIKDGYFYYSAIARPFVNMLLQIKGNALAP